MAEKFIAELETATSLTGSVLVGEQAGVTKQFSIALLTGTSSPIVSAAELGLVADGVSDQTKKLNDAMAAYSLLGGAAIWLSSREGAAFRFNSAVRVPSRIMLIVTAPVLFGQRGSFRIGGVAARTGAKAYLAANVTTGATTLTIDRAASGISGALSTAFAVGDLVSINGLQDGAGESIESQTVRITAINDGTDALTFAVALSFDFKVTYSVGAYEAAYGEPNKTTVHKILTGTLASDLAAGSNVVTLSAGHVARFAVGDYVSLEDEKVAGDIAGSSTNPVHREQAQVVAINSGANTLTLSRRMLHKFETAFAAKVVKISPSIGSSIHNATVTFAEAPDASVVIHTFEIRYAVDCQTVDCSVPNADAYGSRGNGYRIQRALNCWHVRPSGSNPKYTGAGEGYGATLVSATNCGVINPSFAGWRHHILLQGASGCSVSGGQLLDTRLSAIDLHGTEEIGNTIEVDLVEGASLTASASWAAVRVGNVTHMAGAHSNTIAVKRVYGLQNVSGYGVDIVPPSSWNTISLGVVENVFTPIYLSDVTGQAALVANRNTIERTTVVNALDWVVDADGGRNAGGKCHSNLRLRDIHGRGGSFKQWRLRRLDGVEIEGITIEAVATSSTFAWGIDAENVDGLRIYRPRVRGTRKGFRAKNCPGFIVHSPLVEALSGSTVFFTDGGGNAGYTIGLPDWIGFAATKELEAGATASSGSEYPTIGGGFRVT